MDYIDATRPFHETIVLAIQRCNPSPSSGEILHLFQLIKETKIPKGHDEIVAAIDKYFDFPGAEKWTREIYEVKASLLEQKQTIQKKTGNEKKEFYLDKLQQEAEGLLSLLNDRQPGLTTWNRSLREQLQSLHKLTSQALDK